MKRTDHTDRSVIVRSGERFDAMSELRTRRHREVAGSDVIRELAEHDDCPKLPEKRYLPVEKRSAGLAFLGRRLVGGGRAPDRRRNPCTAERQAIVVRFTRRLVCKSRSMHRSEQPIAGPIAREKTARAIRTVGSRRKSEHQDRRSRVAKTRYGTSPVRPVTIRRPLLYRHLLAPCNQPRTTSAVRNLAAELVQRIHARPVCTVQMSEMSEMSETSEMFRDVLKRPDTSEMFRMAVEGYRHGRDSVVVMVVAKKQKGPKATLVLLVRHGQTPTTGVKLPGRAKGLHLSDVGLQQAEAVAQRLTTVKTIDAIYASPLERARETAGPLARLRGIATRIDRGLLECDFGDWTGGDLKDLYKLPEWATVQRYPSGFRFPNGESFTEMQTRMVTAIAHLVEVHRGGTVVAFSHADPIKAAVADALGTHLDLFQRISISTCSVTAIAYGPTGPNVLTVNETGDIGKLLPS